MSEVHESLKNYLNLTSPNIDLNKITILKEKLNGLSNDVYLISLYEGSSCISKFIFRLFGINHKQCDSLLESHIISTLSLSGITPKVLYLEETFRVDQYIENAIHPDYEISLKPFMLDQLSNVLLAYSKISPVYNYITYYNKVNCESEILLINSQDGEYYDIKSNIYDFLVKKTYPQAYNNLVSIMSESKERYRSETICKLNRLKEYLDSFKDIFMTVFPKSSLLVLNHNDIHRLNILLQNDRIVLLDHEYACLNLIGNDIVNYMVETCWDYTLPTFPFYTYKRENFDFNLFYTIYTNYLNKFDTNELPWYNKRIFKQLHDMSHFLRIICIISTLWTLYSIEYLTPTNLEDETNYDTLGSAIDRLEMFEISYQQLVKNLK
jgi:thiamine kinase-like enzyme